jgi:uncharacterized protein YodC (DUF2158 family)
MVFKVGDVVRLKSGGPKMTVQSVGDFSREGLKVGVLCVWFRGEDRQQSIFHPDSLEVAGQDVAAIAAIARRSPFRDF